MIESEAQVWWLASAWVAVTVVAAGVVAVAHRRAQRDLARQTQAAREAQARYRTLLENMPLSVVEEDFSAVAKWLERLRGRGVTDLEGWLAEHPGVVEEQFRSIGFLRANSAMLRNSGARDVDEYASHITAAPGVEGLATFRDELLAMWRGATELSCEFDWQTRDGRRVTSLMHWWAAHGPDGEPDWTRVTVAFVDLSPLRATEARLRETEDRWRLAVRGTDDGIWDLQLATGECFFSERWKEMLGYAPHELADTPDEWFSRVHPADKRLLDDALAAHLRGDTAKLHLEHRVLARDGGYRWFLARGEALRDLAGVPLRIVGSHTDISERKAAETSLRESERRYRTLFEHAVEGVYESSPTEGFLAVNPALARLLGYAGPEQFTAECRPIESRFYVSPTRRAEFLAALADGDRVVDFESEVRCRDGSRRWILENVRAVRDEQGALRHLQGFVTDVTERRRFEAALAAEKDRLAVTLQALGEAVVAIDAEGRIQFCNRAAEHLLGRAAGELAGQAVTETVSLRHRRTLATVTVPLAEALAARRICELPVHTELLPAGDRPPVLVEGQCAPLEDARGRPAGAVLVLRDVGERARLEEELLRASKLESLGLLAGGIAHDFNNLLTIAMGNLTLALLDAPVAERAGSWLREAEGGLLRARDLTLQLLTFAKGGEPVRAAVDLPGVVREAARFALHGASVSCEFDFAPDLPPADVDRAQIGQVVQNLVINAVHAMPGGGVLRIALGREVLPPGHGRTVAPGDYVRLAVADRGHGIRPEHLGRIFDPYFTTKDGGTGLGLATVYSIVKRHQGTIDVQSEAGRGTTFTIWLPAAREQPQVAAPEQAEPGRLSGRVLFMDDEEPIRLMARRLLAHLGLEVVLARDGSEAVSLYRAAQQAGQDFDLVVMDLTVLGGMGGHEAMAELRKIDPAVRAIVSSGYSSDPVLADYRAHGFAGMVAKPYRVNEFAAELRRVLGRQAAGQRHG